MTVLAFASISVIIIVIHLIKKHESQLIDEKKLWKHLKKIEKNKIRLYSMKYFLLYSYFILE